MVMNIVIVMMTKMMMMTAIVMTVKVDIMGILWIIKMH